MFNVLRQATKCLNKALWVLFVGTVLYSAWAQDGAAAHQKPAPQAPEKMTVNSNAQQKIKFDDSGKLLTEKDLKEMQSYTVSLKRKHGFRFHFFSGNMGDRPIDDVLDDLVRANGVGAAPNDKSAILLVLNNKRNPKKTELRLRLGNGWDGILSYGHFDYGVEKYVQPELDKEPIDAEKLSNGIMELYTRMISVAINKAKEKGITAEEPQPAATAQPAATTQPAATAQPAANKPQNPTAPSVANAHTDATAPSVANSDDALAAKVIADATARANNGSENQEAAKGTMRARPVGLKDPGIPASYSGELPPKPGTRRYVCDWGDLLMPSDRAYVEFLGERLDKLTTAELVLVTVPTRGDMAIKDFSIKIANNWGIGKADKNNGCMLLGIRDKLLKQQSGRLRIEVGRYLEGRLNDAKCGRILDDFALPPFLSDDASKEEQSAGLVSAYEYLAKEIAAEYGADLGIKIDLYQLPDEPHGDFIVSDSAHVLTVEDLATVEKLGRKLQEKTGKRFYFVALPELKPQFELNNVYKELQDNWKQLSLDKQNTMVLLVNSNGLFDAKSTRPFSFVTWGANIKESMANVKLNILYNRLLKDLKHKNSNGNESSSYVDKEEASHAFRDYYVCLAQKAAAGKGEDGAKVLELPEGTISYEDFTRYDMFYQLFGAYVVIVVIVFFFSRVWGVVILLWPVALVMLFFPKGREFLGDWLDTGGYSGSGGYSSSSDDDSYSSRRSSYSRSSSSSSSSSSSYGGGSFGGGGADR